MAGHLSRMDVKAAREDLQNRTLSGIGLEFAQLIYLASTRDYNTGRYYHDGLAFHFSPQAAAAALAEAHKEVFVDLALRSLEELVGQLEAYLRSVGTAPKEIIRAWKRLEPYRIAIPLGCDPLTAGFFLANLKIALAIVESRL
jgi:hypothetical protein